MHTNTYVLTDNAARMLGLRASKKTAAPELEAVESS
jgi:hypothetical protein